jgi:surfeit locus 1 family protein
MRRLPVIPTLLVAAAVAVMIGLGIWQLQRKAEKEALLARYEKARLLPPILLTPTAAADPAILYRRAVVTCERVTERRLEGGRDVQDRSGWVHLVGCDGSAARPAFRVVLGWSDKPVAYTGFSGGRVEGVVARDRENTVRLVLANPPKGLEAARPPALDQIPNNHLFYAIQWFFFAGAAAVIYVLALRRRSR